MISYFKFLIILSFFCMQNALAASCEEDINSLKLSVNQLVQSGCNDMEVLATINLIINNMNSRPQECRLSELMPAREKILSGLMALMLDGNPQQCTNDLNASLALIP